eukprot:scaffold7474_cov113-Isochrysis_galbana.AAC.1
MLELQNDLFGNSSSAALKKPQCCSKNAKKNGQEPINRARESWSRWVLSLSVKIVCGCRLSGAQHNWVLGAEALSGGGVVGGPAGQ